MTALDRLAEIEALANAATEGPWTASGPFIGAVNAPEEDDPIFAEVNGEDDERAELDAEFIAHARTDVPALVAALRAVLAEADALDVLAKQSEGLSFDPTQSGMATAHRLAARGIRGAITSALDGAR